MTGASEAEGTAIDEAAAGPISAYAAAGTGSARQRTANWAARTSTFDAALAPIAVWRLFSLRSHTLSALRSAPDFDDASRLEVVRFYKLQKTAVLIGHAAHCDAGAERAGEQAVVLPAIHGAP